MKSFNILQAEAEAEETCRYMANISSNPVERKTRVPCPLPGFTVRGHRVIQEQGPHVLMRRTRLGYTNKGHRIMQETGPQNQLPLPGYTLRGHRVLQPSNEEVEKLAKKVLRDRINEEA